MRNNLIIALLALLSALAGYGMASRYYSTTPERVDAQLSAAFSVLDMAGVPVSSTTFPDPVLLNFWATWCTPCIAELPLLAEFARDGGLPVIAIAEADSRARVEEFVAANGITLPVLVAADGVDVSTDLGNTRRVLPFSVVLRGGRVVSVKSGVLTPADLDKFVEVAKN